MGTMEENAFVLPRSHLGAFGPYLFVAWPGLPIVSLDAALVDEIESPDAALLLRLGDLAVQLHIADGPVGAKRVADALSPYARNRRITAEDIYRDAKRRLSRLTDSDYHLMIGHDPVIVHKDAINAGTKTFKIENIRHQADMGKTLELPTGARVQAALLLLVFEAEHRPGGREGFEVLSRRIAEFERSRTPEQR